MSVAFKQRLSFLIASLESADSGERAAWAAKQYLGAHCSGGAQDNNGGGGAQQQQQQQQQQHAKQALQELLRGEIRQNLPEGRGWAIVACVQRVIAAGGVADGAAARAACSTASLLVLAAAAFGKNDPAVLSCVKKLSAERRPPRVIPLAPVHHWRPGVDVCGKHAARLRLQLARDPVVAAACLDADAVARLLPYIVKQVRGGGCGARWCMMGRGPSGDA